MKFSISAIIIIIILLQTIAKGTNSSALASLQTAEFSIYSLDTIYLSAKKDENSPNSINLEWTNPNQTQLTWIVDDASFENSLNIQPLKEGWLGNYFPYTWVCKLYSAELFWVGDSMPSAEHLTVDIFDTNHMVLGSSEPFIAQSGGWQIVHLPLIQVNGPFYAMVHWNNLSGESLKLGSDENGPGAENNYGWCSDGSDWSHLSDSGYSTNVFGLRVVGAINGKGSISEYVFSEQKFAENKLANDKTLPLQNSDAKSDNPGRRESLQEITEYRIFRRAYTADPPGNNEPGNGDFILIATVPGSTNHFEDNDLPNSQQNCYEYKIQGITEYFSVINSNIDWDCLSVGIDEIVIKTGISPNPANESAKLDFPSEIKFISVFSASGQNLNVSDVTNKTSLSIYTSAYISGVYYIRFSAANGDSFIRKLVVVQ